MADTSELTAQTPKPEPPEPKPDLKPTKNGVFLMRAPEMPFEEFKEYCVKRFREAGLIKN